MDVYDARGASPMLISEEIEAFDSPDYLFELKLDGSRCLAYVEPGFVELRNKRMLSLLHLFPELADIHKAVRGRCILDGELVVLDNGKPDFEALLSREMTTKRIKIEIAAEKQPASFVAFDILYCDGEELTKLPLEERKRILRAKVDNTAYIAVSKAFERQGIALFDLTVQQGLEGIVAKRRDSKYYYGKRTKEWVKIKNLVDEDFLACGYIDKGKGACSLVLGKQEGTSLSYEGHVTLGVSFHKVAGIPTTANCPFENPPAGNEQAVWFDPPQECTVVYMARTGNGGMRQPRLKRFGPAI